MITVWRESIRMALRRLVVHKVRSLLTMLGVLIGTGSVVALVAIGQGASGSVTANIESLGTNLLTVTAGSSVTSGTRGASGSATTLTTADAAAIAKLSGVAAVASEAQSSALVVGEDSSTNTTTTIVGTTSSYLKVRSYKLQRGTFITAVAQAERLPVAVLGSGTLETLALTSSQAIGSTVTIGGKPFTVVGVLQEKGGTGQSADDQVIVPLSVLQRNIAGTDNIRSIGVSLEDGIDQETAKTQLESVMRLRHSIADATNDDFTVTSQSQLVDTFSSVSDTLTILLGGVAAISLIVGGIGIMNMMLVSVQERTYEIGLRKALGARSRDILAQFVSEAVSISVLGALLGVVAGVASARIASAVAGWNTVLSPTPVLVAFGFSVLIGVAFGVIPAWKAARLDPVTALRTR